MSSISKQYSSLLRLYSKTHYLLEVKKLHSLILKTLQCTNTFLLNNLITSYSKSNLPSYAYRVFLQIPYRNLFSWNTLLSSAAKSGCLSEMCNIFNSMPERDCISWNSVISGFAFHGFPEKAVDNYKLMLREGYNMQSRITFSTMLIISSTMFSSALGMQVHCQAIKHGFRSHVFVGSPLVGMYSKAGLVSEAWLAFQEVKEKNLVLHNTMIMGFLRCGMVEESKRLFAGMRERDSISWTTMITGFTHNGCELEAIGLFNKMSYAGVNMDQYTFGSVLTACGALAALDQGKQIHAFIIRTNFDDNVFVGSALVDMYSKCKSIQLAESFFKRMKVKNLVTWTAMLVGYGQNGCYEEAVGSFLQMQRLGVKPDDFTVGSALSSCANIASLEEGAQFHCQAIVLGLMPFITVSNALVTLYGKCGNIEDSQRLFDEMTTMDEVSWTALVSGYAQIGKAKETIDLFEKMISNGVKPDGVTFIGVLSACSRATMVEKGYYYFVWYVLPSLDVSIQITPCPSKLQEFLVRMDITNRTSTKSFSLQQLSCVGDQLGILTLPANESICPSEVLHAGQALSCFFMLKDCKSFECETALPIHGKRELLDAPDGNRKNLIDASKSPLLDFHQHERYHQGKTAEGGASNIDFILITELQEKGSVGSHSSILSYHACHCSITDKMPVWWLMEGPRVISHDFSVSFCEVDFELSISNCTKSDLSIGITTFDFMPETKSSDDLISDPNINQGGWHDLSLANGIKEISNVQPFQSRKSPSSSPSSQSISPFIWCAASSTVVKMEPFSTAKIPLRICVFSPGTFDLSNYELQWNDGPGGDAMRDSSGMSRGHPFYLTVLPSPQ